MLDWAHGHALRDVDGGSADDSPALRTLVDAGLVRRLDDGGHALTDAGRVALEADIPSRLERVGWFVLTTCLTLLVVTTVVGWLT